MPLSAGNKLSRCEIVEPSGKGGTGQVFRAGGGGMRKRGAQKTEARRHRFLKFNLAEADRVW
jgi:hypothetical protein